MIRKMANVVIKKVEGENEFQHIIPRLTEILFSAYQEFPEYGVENEAEAERYLWWLYRADPDGMFLAYVEDEMAGFIASHSQWWDKYIGVFVGEIHEISVDSAFHGMGIGSRLMKVAEDYFVENKRTVAGLWVGVKNDTAIRFYEKRGYVRAEVRGPWLRMRKYLGGVTGG